MKSSARHIAERYVTALFEVARDEQAIEAVEKDMRTLGAALAQSEDFRGFLTNPLLTRDGQARVAEHLLDFMKASLTTKRFVALLARQRRLPILPEIIALFATKAMEARGEMQAELITAAPLKAQEATQVAARLSKAMGKKVSLETHHDKSLLGGVVIKIGSQQLDASLAGKLSRLAIALKAA